MEKTREQIKKEVEETMLNLHNKIYKYRIYDEYRGTYTVDYRKGRLEIKSKMTLQEVREMKLKELGI
jgi:hypothetical protein